MTNREMFIELAKSAYLATAGIHAETELARFTAWKSLPAKGRNKYEPTYDRAEIVATFEDLLGSGMDAAKEFLANTPD